MNEETLNAARELSSCCFEVVIRFLRGLGLLPTMLEELGRRLDSFRALAHDASPLLQAAVEAVDRNYNMLNSVLVHPTFLVLAGDSRVDELRSDLLSQAVTALTGALDVLRAVLS